MNLQKLHKQMLAHEEDANRVRAQIIKELQDRTANAPRGLLPKIAAIVPKYNKINGAAHLHKAIKGKFIDPEVLKAIDELIPAENA